MALAWRKRWHGLLQTYGPKRQVTLVTHGAAVRAGRTGARGS